MTLFPSQDTFVRGEISPRLHSRASLDLYRSALAMCRNFLTLPHGGLRKRGGTRFVAPVKYENKATRLVRFVFSADQAYQLEFGDEYVRVYAYGAYVTEFAAPWAHTQLDALQFVQSADVMWVTHPDLPPQRIIRRSNADWTVEQVLFLDGPFQPLNFDETVTVAPSASEGTITLTASEDVFTPASVGRLFRIEMESYAGIKPWEPNGVIKPEGDDPPTEFCRYDGNVYRITDVIDVSWRFGATPPTHTKGTEPDGPGVNDEAYGDVVGVNLEYVHSGYGVAVISSYTSPTEVAATVLSRFPAEVVSAPSYLWSFGVFGPGRYPNAVALFEERLFFASGQYVYGSKTGDFTSFATGEKDDDAVEFLIVSGEANEILWLADADGFLAVGTTGGVRSLSGAGIDEALTPSSFKSRGSATAGCSSLQPVNTGQSILYVPRGGAGLVEMVVNQSARFESAELFIISEHIPKQTKGFTSVAFQARPDPIAWVSGQNGELVGLTYQRDQEVRGPHRHTVAGLNAKVSSLISTPSQGDGDDLTMIVHRVVGGNERQYIEMLVSPLEYVDQAKAYALDAGLSYSGSPVNTVSGLDHLEGEKVAMLADGFVFDGLTVSGGAVSLPNAKVAETIHVGLSYAAEARTLDLDVGGRDGSLMGRKKRVLMGYFSVLETDVSRLSLASMMKNRWQKAKVYDLAQDAEAGTLQTRLLPPIPVDDSWAGQGAVKFRHEGPLPCTIRAFTPAFDNE